jgi:hypothetical protein
MSNEFKGIIPLSLNEFYKMTTGVTKPHRHYAEARNDIWLMLEESKYESYVTKANEYYIFFDSVYDEENDYYVVTILRKNFSNIITCFGGATVIAGSVQYPSIDLKLPNVKAVQKLILLKKLS